MIGILVPMPEEIASIRQQMDVKREHRIGMREFCEGSIQGKPCVLAMSRIGKVASAVTASTMIQHFGVEGIVVIGAGGGVHDSVHIGDVVVGESAWQYDMDASPLFPQFEIPLLNKTTFVCDSDWVKMAVSAFEKATKRTLSYPFLSDEIKIEFKLEKPTCHIGKIACADLFLDHSKITPPSSIWLENTLCVDMEAGAVGQVCYESDVKYVVIRVISDKADQNAKVDFVQFYNKVVARINQQLIAEFIKQL